jgi:hypothetical protein
VEANRKPQPQGEPSALPPRLLYGYVRVTRDDTERAAALKADLLSFCHTYGYMLGTVFTDWGVEDTALARPGFASLLDVCNLVDSHGVVVPARSHLSGHGETRAVLERQIRRTGAQLVVAAEITAGGGPSPSTADISGPQADADGAPC